MAKIRARMTTRKEEEQEKEAEEEEEQEEEENIERWRISCVWDHRQKAVFMKGRVGIDATAYVAGAGTRNADWTEE